MYRTKCKKGEFQRRENHHSAKQLPKLRRAAYGVPPIEMLEQRMLLSVSVATIFGPFTTITGGVWTYAVTETGSDGSATGTETRTNIGPVTAPSGQSAIEQDISISATASDGSSDTTTDQGYYALTSQGLVQYAEVDDAGTDTTETDIYTPSKIVIPASLTAGDSVIETDTDTSTLTTTSSDGTTSTNISTNTDSTTITLSSETLSSRSVPAGMFSVYLITNEKTVTESDGTQGTNITETYFSPQVGIVEIDETDADGITATEKLTQYSIPGDTMQFVAQPVETPQGQALPTVSVEFLNSSNQLDTSINGDVTLTLQGGNGTLSGIATVAADKGLATFTGLSVDQGGAYTLIASSASANSTVTSNQFNILATTLTWTGGGDGTNWSDPANWQEDQAPEGGENLVFPDSGALSINNDIDSLSLNSISFSSQGYTLSGLPISLSGSLNSTSGSDTYNIDTTLVGTPTIDDQDGDLTIQSVLSGSGGASFTGNGTVTLDSANPYSGNTTINPGITVDLATSSANLGTGQLIVANSASSASAPQLNNTVPGLLPLVPTITLANPLVFQSGASLSTDGSLIFSNAVTLNGSNGLLEPATDGTTLELDGEITGTGTLNTNVSGKVLVTGDVDSGSNLSVSAGELDISGALLATTSDPFQVSVLGGTLQLLSGITGAGGIDISGGTLASGGAPGYGGIITVESGTETLNLTPAVSVLGTGQLIFNTPGTTALPTDIPTVADASSTQTLSIDLPVTFQSGAIVNTQGTVQFTNQVTLNGTTSSTINAQNSLAFTNRIVGTGSTQFKETGNVTTTVSATVASGVTLYQLGPGELDLGGVLQGTAGGTNQVFGQGGTIKLLAGLTGGGGIDMQGGILLAENNSGYTGNITLEQTPDTTNVSVQVQVTPGTSAFGTGQIILATPPTADGNSPKIVNTLGASQAYSLGNQVIFQSVPTAFGALYASLNVSGSVSFAGGISLQGANHYIFTSASSDVVTFPSAETIGAIGPSILARGLFLDGPGTFNLFGTVSAGVNVTAFDLTASGAGSLNLGGTLQGGASQVTVDAGAVVMQGSGAVSGSGGIIIVSGTLTSDPTPNTSGDLLYNGPITLNSGVVATDFDSIDRSPFGDGTLTLNGATLQSSTAAASNGSAFTPGVSNPIVSTGPSSISGSPGRFKLAGAVNIAVGGSIAFSGDVVLAGGVSGVGGITLVDSTTILEVPGNNPGFTGIVSGNGGRIFVSTLNGALGTAKLDSGQNSRSQFTVETQAIADPILNNPVEVVAGTLFLQGLLTFSAGITVDSGAILIIEGAGSQIVSSGDLSGAGNVIVEGGTFSTPGGTSGFTGTIQNDTSKITPTLTVTDAGGTFNGSPFPATATLTGPGITTPVGMLEGVSPTFTYYTGTTTTGTGTSTAPSTPGMYTVVGSFAGSTDYAAVQSAPVTFTIVAADKLVFSIEPHNSAAGEIGPVIVQIENSKGQVVTSDNSTVTLSLASGPGILGGTVTVKAKHGVATFDHLFLTTAGTYTLKATDGSDTAAISQSFKITPARPAKLVFVQQPSGASAGSSIGTIVVDVEDQYGNLETGFDSYVTLWLESKSRFGSIRYLAAIRAVNGIATFKDISIDEAGTYRLLASPGPFVVGISDSFTISSTAPQRQSKCDF